MGPALDVRRGATAPGLVQVHAGSLAGTLALMDERPDSAARQSICTGSFRLRPGRIVSAFLQVKKYPHHMVRVFIF